MCEDDFPAFSEMLDAVAGLYPRGAVLAQQKAMFFRVLSGYSLPAVQAGVDAHVRDTERGRFLPLPADVIAQLDGMAADDGRPGPEVAWATAIRAKDEAATLVWTEETSQAWGVAHAVHQAGDEVGARMAFKEAYTRLIADARKARKPVRWVESLGHDPAQGAEVIAQAQAAGLLPAPAPVALLKGPAEAEPTPAQLRKGKKRVAELMLKLNAERSPNGLRQKVERLQSLADAGTASPAQRAWLADATALPAATVQPSGTTVGVPREQWPWIKREQQAAAARETQGQELALSPAWAAGASSATSARTTPRREPASLWSACARMERTATATK
jgi:hypothetical protein